jgi:hypothetical protein
MIAKYIQNGETVTVLKAWKQSFDGVDLKGRKIVRKDIQMYQISFCDGQKMRVESDQISF